MAKKRISRKELVKGPDEFLTITGKGFQWARSNTKPLIFGISAFFVVIVLIAGYRIYATHRQQSASAILSQSIAAYQEAQRREEDPAKVLAVIKPDFERLIDEYGAQPAGRAGRMILAHAALAGHDPDQAAMLYREALSNFDDNPSLRNILHNGLASAYLQKGDNAAAIDEFKKITASSSLLMKDAALFHLGRLYRETGENEKSREAYQQLSNDFPDSIYAGMAQEKASG